MMTTNSKRYRIHQQANGHKVEMVINAVCSEEVLSIAKNSICKNYEAGGTSHLLIKSSPGLYTGEIHLGLACSGLALLHKAVVN